MSSCTSWGCGHAGLQEMTGAFWRMPQGRVNPPPAGSSSRARLGRRLPPSLQFCAGPRHAALMQLGCNRAPCGCFGGTDSYSAAPIDRTSGFFTEGMPLAEKVKVLG